MIYAVAERINDPTLTNTRVEDWSRAWRKHRLRAILSTPAMVRGNIKARMANLLGLEPGKIINLLWPDNQIGTWDKTEAMMSAIALRDWWEHDASVTGVALLGRRVCDAFAIDGDWGYIRVDEDAPPIICLPHPSGRNRILNEGDTVRKIKSCVAEFTRLCGVCNA